MSFKVTFGSFFVVTMLTVMFNQFMERLHMLGKVAFLISLLVT